MNEQRRVTSTGDLWAVGYDDPMRAAEVKKEIARLGWEECYLALSDLVVVVRHLDGSFTIDHEPFPALANLVGGTVLGFIAGLVLAAPVAGAAVGALLGGAGTAVATATVGIEDEFVRTVQTMMKPGTSALFVLAHKGDMEVVLHCIRGLGGTVLETNVDVAQAQLVQATLAAAKVDSGGELGLVHEVEATEGGE
jgi:uncharacterized membrane protein